MSAVFTMRLKNVIDVVHADVDSGVGLGLDTYPIFDEKHRAILNRKIVNHYWNREIGRETIEDWRFALRRTMNEIMDPYNELYKTQLIKFDPLSTMDIRSTQDSSTDTETEGETETSTVASGTSDGMQVSSTYPVTSLGKETNQGQYADSGNESAGSSENKSDGDETHTEKSKSNTAASSASSGYTGPASVLLQQFRATILNIDLDIVMDLNPLFMNIWDNGDTFTESGFIA